MSECTFEENSELTKQQRLIKIIMEEGEKIYRMKDSKEKARLEEILEFLVEYQIILAKDLLCENLMFQD